MARKTKIGDITSWHRSLVDLRDTGRCSRPGFFMPYHFVTLSLLLREQGAGQIHLPRDIQEYAIRIGLWEALGLEPPILDLELYPVGSRYHPITFLKDEACVGNAASALSGMLTEHAIDANDQTRDNVFIMLTELLGNCYHHARSVDGVHGVACAQTWYRDSRAQFAISDSGIGIRQSLSESEHLLKKLSKENSCSLACRYGVSSKLGKGHAGYGLALARDLALQTPESILFVQAGKEALLVDNGREALIGNFPYALSGTHIFFEWDLNKRLDLAGVYEKWPNSEIGDDNEFFV